LKKIYFPGLTEVRAIAAILVIIHHIELYKYRQEMYSLYDTFLNPFISSLGKAGVYIFFTLSGFLISYLLLCERKKNGHINIIKFYTRRALRIWPLYYLILLLSWLLIPSLANYFNFLQNETYYYDNILKFTSSPYLTIVLFIFMLPNLALRISPKLVGASQAWSVGVEEQFYAIWPHLFNQVKNKQYLLLILILISCLPFFVEIISLINSEFSSKIRSILAIFPIYFMAMGGIGAFLLFYYKELITPILKNPLIFKINTVLLIICLFYSSPSIIFASVIMLQILLITRNTFKINLRNVQLNKLGEISYGLYMYHPIIMYLCFSICNYYFKIENIILYNLIIYLSIFGLTYALSNFSYNHFEKIFINLKNKKYTIIKNN